MAEKNGTVDFFAGFLIGALVGAAAALLFAPQSGEETRTLIRDKGIELKEQADEVGEQARKKAEAIQVQARQRAEELQAQVKHAVEEGRSAAAASKQDMLTKLEEEAPSGESAPVEEIDITEIIEE
jgi:gas vesicle protein